LLGEILHSIWQIRSICGGNINNELETWEKFTFCNKININNELGTWDKLHIPVEETLSQLLDGEQRTHHGYLCHLLLMFCRNSLLAVYWPNLILQVNMGPSVLAAQKASQKLLFIDNKRSLQLKGVCS
jgi:hypothetical protein